MSDIYIRLIQRVRNEYEVVHSSLEFVQSQWHRQNLSLPTKSATSGDLQRALEALEATYFIRLFSNFEGFLKEHMTQYHPHIFTQEDARAVWLIDRVTQLHRPRISTSLREQVHNIRQYRNFLVHPGGALPPEVFFIDALAQLSKFVDKLPEPR